jgi:hypothetical protein
MYAFVCKVDADGEIRMVGSASNEYAGGTHVWTNNSGSSYGQTAGWEHVFYLYSESSISVKRWKDLYLSGDINDGTFAVSVQEAQAAYDHISLVDEHINWKAATENFLTTGTGQFGGNVGIGTVPGELLHIKGSSPVMKIENTSVTLRPAFFLQHVDGDRAGFFYYDKSYGGDTDLQGDLVIHTDNVGDVIFSTVNNIGISITTPPTKLSVDGGISMKERADHETVVAGFAQLWVKNAGNGELWFTDDAGNDTQIV